VRGGVDEQGHKGRVVFRANVANRWLHVGDHAAPQVVDHPFAIDEEIHAPLAPGDNRLALADDEADGINKVWRKTKVSLMRRMRQVLGSVEECQRIAAMPSQRKSRGFILHGLLNDLFVGPRRWFVWRRGNDRDGELALGFQEELVGLVPGQAECAEPTSHRDTIPGPWYGRSPSYVTKIAVGADSKFAGVDHIDIWRI
jgi:hypothetical protein